MHKLKTFLRRVRTMSLRRMLLYAGKARADSGKPTLFILFDMLWCAFRYGVGYLDYLTFGFVHLGARQRRTYMTMNDNLRLTRALNDPEKKALFEDKIAFLALFQPFIGRDWLDLRKASDAEFAAFTAGHPVFFAKETGNYGGHGVERICVQAGEDLPALQRRLVGAQQFLAEQAVVQHPEMDRLCASSVNTLRIVTLAKGGEIHVMYSLVRMGSGGAPVDNISSGGMYAPVRGGRIAAPAFCDRTGEYYEVHPATGTALVGFAIPLFGEALALVRRAAAVVPEVRYVGWDIAITQSGPVIIEGNTLPSYDMCQNYRHLGEQKTGVKPRFIEVLGDEFFA